MTIFGYFTFKYKILIHQVLFIKYPFEQLTYQNPNYSLIRINKYHPQGSDENKEKTLTFSEDVETLISDLLL